MSSQNTGGQRAFALKRNKMTAADVRRHIMMGSLLLHPQNAMQMDSIDSSTPQTINLIEIAEPLDVEDILSQRKSNSSVHEHISSNSNLRRVAEFPVDDIEVRLVHRDQLTVESPIPSNLSGVDSLVNDIIQTYNDSFSLVQRKYLQYSSGEAYIRLLMERPIIAQTTPKQIFEVDSERPIGRSVSTAGEDQIAKRDSFGSHYSSDSMCTVGSSSGGTNRDDILRAPHQLHSSASDPTVPGVVQRISNTQLDQINEARRRAHRQNALISLLPPQSEADVIERRSPAPFPVEHTGQKLFIKVLKLQLEPSFEPVFGTIVLYDLKERRKISENFYFDLNDDSLRAMISQHADCVDDASKCTQAVFSISQPLNDIFIVIKLEKVLQPCEVADACEPYVKEDKNKERLMQMAQQYCERLGAFRMPLGWFAIDLNQILNGSYHPDKTEPTMIASSVSGQDITPASPTTLFDVESIISMDRISTSTSGTFRRVGSGTSSGAVFIGAQQSQKNRTPLQKRKLFGGLHQTVSQNDATTTGSGLETDSLLKDGGSPLTSLSNLQPLLLSLNSFFRQEAERLTDEDLCKMLADCRKGGSKLARLKTFPITFKMELSGGCGESLMRNLLYVYPRSVNLSSRSGPSRNIAIHVELMNAQEKPIYAIFGKSSGPNITFSADTAVSYHNKTPTFCDEIKINLPVDLNDGHHLLFTFFHITCKANKVGDEVKIPIGYSWIPLLKDGRLQTGEFALPIALEQLPQSYGYLSPDVNLPNVKWLEGHKPLFDIKLEAVTTVHTQDSHLDKFLLAYQSLSINDKKNPPVSEADLKDAIRSVIKARPEPMVAFLYVILDKLLALIANPPYTVSVSAVCFEVLGQLVKICTVLLNSFRDAHGRSSLLTTYIHYHKIALKETSIVQSNNSKTEPKLESTVRMPTSPESKHLLDIIKEFERTNYMKASVEGDYELKTPKKGLFLYIEFLQMMHEELALQWVISGGAAREMAFLNSWFFLELMVKSMAEHLSLSNRLYLPRKLRFSEAFIQDLNALSQAIVNEVIQRTSKDPRQSQSISTSWAYFLRDCFSLMDRTFVMTLIGEFNREVAIKIGNSTESCIVPTLMLIKLDFLRIIASHEHFVVLNLPFGSSNLQGMSTSHSGGSFHSAASAFSSSSEGSVNLSVSLHHSSSQIQPSSPGNSSISSSSQANESHSAIGSAELTAEFRSRHFLIGLALADLASVLDTSNTLLHSRAIGLIRNLLSSHELDARLLDNAVKARIASLYLPMIGIVLDASTQLHDPYSKSSNVNYDISTPISNGYTTEMDNGPFISDKVMLAIGGMNFSPPCSPRTERKHIGLVRPSISLENTRQLLACFCWALKNMERSSLRQWIRDLSSHRILQFLDVLQLAVSCFEFRSSFCPNQGITEITEEIKNEGSNVDDSSVKELSRKKSRSAADSESGIRWRKETKDSQVKGSWKSCTGSSGGHSSDEPIQTDEDVILEATLCTEIPLIVLDTLELIIRVVSVLGSDYLFYVLSSVLKVLMHILACNQSVQTLENVFASQRAIVTKFPDLLFEQETEQCGELCLHLLRHCASRLPAVRSQAAASLYLLMRQSFESGASFSKVKMQITMSLSTLVSTGTKYGDWINEDCLRHSLKTVLTYSETDASIDSQLRNTTFSEQVKDLVFNLHMILSDTVKMKEYTNDFEMLIDLMYRVAKGYQNNPDLRLTWLINMANKHAARDNAAEAAQCMLHAAALAAEYISMREYDVYVPKGAAAFEAISDNILEESAVSDDVISPDEEGICESRHFTRNGLVHLVEKTAQFMEKAQMYESMIQLYKVITPILEENRDYRHLAQVHSCLSQALSRIEPTVPLIEDIADAWYSPLPSADKRCFGTYFRVGFYGSRFGDLDGVEFIYKEPAITKLSEISHRLDTFYTDRFGKGVLEVIKDSNTVDRNRLDSTKAYLQITYVEPYLENWERRRRPTHFERNHRLYRFVYATPFTKDGRAHGDLKDQYKRRTVLATQYCFPYVKTRLRVVSREQIILTPIEVAIEDVQKRTRELAAATVQDPPDAKMLQMVLQGCIGTTVNQGPIEVANVFLTNMILDEHGKPMDKFQNKLRLCFKDFSKKCADALQKNRKLIQADQQAYQNELQKNYIEFTKRMAPIVGIRKTKCSEAHTLKAVHAAAVAAELGPVTAV
uniref:Bm4167 n=1 Tax=Brugia malayi TaxID=6279 RepID=A0A1I9GCZ0_BRUMA|nr:Bm4167 [Brugia malayi]